MTTHEGARDVDSSRQTALEDYARWHFEKTLMSGNLPQGWRVRHARRIALAVIRNGARPTASWRI